MCYQAAKIDLIREVASERKKKKVAFGAEGEGMRMGLTERVESKGGERRRTEREGTGGQKPAARINLQTATEEKERGEG